MKMHNLNFPAGLSARRFLAEYWQQRPLLMRRAMPDLHCRLQAETLAGLACEAHVESRLILEKHGSIPWEVRYGPFSEHDFSTLGETHWTLLVQDVDKYLPLLAQMVEYFRFIPDWRFDDIMVSYAVDQGSVGPHTDDYDVFLFQASGRRRWQIHYQQVAPADFIPGLDLRILSEFNSEQEWLLKPGDMLYLPPNIAHWGVAEGECLTCSIGFHAPALREIVASRCEDLVAQRIPDERYRDGRLTIQTSPAEIRPEVIRRLDELFSTLSQHEAEDRLRWFGRFITEQKQNLSVEAPAARLEPLDFMNRFRTLGVIYRNLWARMAFTRGTTNDSLFVNGTEYSLLHAYGGFLPVITHYRELHFGYMEAWLEQPACLRLVCDLYNDGHYEFIPAPSA